MSLVGCLGWLGLDLIRPSHVNFQTQVMICENFHCLSSTIIMDLIKVRFGLETDHYDYISVISTH